jgi:hypothetical protein
MIKNGYESSFVFLRLIGACLVGKSSARVVLVSKRGGRVTLRASAPDNVLVSRRIFEPLKGKG